MKVDRRVGGETGLFETVDILSEDNAGTPLFVDQQVSIPPGSDSGARRVEGRVEHIHRPYNTAQLVNSSPRSYSTILLAQRLHLAAQDGGHMMAAEQAPVRHGEPGAEESCTLVAEVGPGRVGRTAPELRIAEPLLRCLFPALEP